MTVSIRIPLLLLVLLPGLLLAVDANAPVQRGTVALVQMQHPDGSFDEVIGVNALAGLALLAGGHTPTRGVYRDASRRCLAYIIQQQDELTGFIGDRVGTMYSHGFATLYLAESYGMTADDRCGEALQGAVGCILRAQNLQGGWRYDPAAGDADISVTVCQVNALRAAFNVGIGGMSAQEAVSQALQYVRSCHNGDGSFRYRAESPAMRRGAHGPEAVPRAAAGIMSLMGGGLYALSDPTLSAGLQLLREQASRHATGKGHYFWYGQYYAAQALYLSPRGDDWQQYWQVAAPAMLAQQSPDGLWRGPDEWGPAFNTAMALLILQIPKGYLPIFQK